MGSLADLAERMVVLVGAAAVAGVGALFVLRASASPFNVTMAGLFVGLGMLSLAAHLVGRGGLQQGTAILGLAWSWLLAVSAGGAFVPGFLLLCLPALLRPRLTARQAAATAAAVGLALTSTTLGAAAVAVVDPCATVRIWGSEMAARPPACAGWRSVSLGGPIIAGLFAGGCLALANAARGWAWARWAGVAAFALVAAVGWRQGLPVIPGVLGVLLLAWAARPGRRDPVWPRDPVPPTAPAASWR